MTATFACRAGYWLLDSGIRRPSGGFSRYYLAEAQKYRPISTEITGYAASALVYLFRTTGDEEFLNAAKQTARFLLSTWDSELETFPFEHPSPSPESEHLSYFFDCGIIIRGVLAVWRETRDDQLLETARAAARGMIADFRAHQDYHPILHLPHKSAAERNGQWSRNPGCYQLKAALAWRDVAAITGEPVLADAWKHMLESALSTHATFLSGASSQQKLMDLLHPYCYFLEGLLPELASDAIRETYARGLDTVAHHLREIAPVFARSDVYAQLLRARLFADAHIPVDMEAAKHEASALSEFQVERQSETRLDGGFLFGKRCGELIPHVNPVSTAFAVQALEMWRAFEHNEAKPLCLSLLI